MTDLIAYVFICPQVVGNPETGFRIEHHNDGRTYPTRRQATRRGLAYRGSDDFNIGVLRNGRLVELWWMDERIDEPDGTLDEIASGLGIAS